MGREFDLTRGVLYRTTDGGQHWSAIWRGDNLARYIWIDPRDFNVIYLSTGIFDREAANSDPQAHLPGGEGVLKSIDGGETWQQANNGLDNLYVGSLFMHPTNPDILLAGTGNNQYYDHNGVYLTIDGAQSWRLVQGDANINAVEFSGTDPNIAYAGSANAIYRSADGGLTWERVSGNEDNGWGAPGVRAGFPIDLQVDPRDPDRLFANNYGGGNFVSEDGGRTWEVASAGYTGRRCAISLPARSESLRRHAVDCLSAVMAVPPGRASIRRPRHPSNGTQSRSIRLIPGMCWLRITGTASSSRVSTWARAGSR